MIFSTVFEETAVLQLLISFLFSVRNSHPHKRTNQTYALSVLVLVLIVIFLFVNMVFKFLKVSSGTTTLFFISAALFAFCVIEYRRYLNHFSWLTLSPLQDTLQIGRLTFFEMTIHSVFLAFRLYSLCMAGEQMTFFFIR